jgi:integrase
MYRRANSWITEFHCNGTRYIKSWGDISKTVAKEKEEKFKTEVREGKHDQKSKKILFEKFSEKYLEAAKIDKKPKSSTRNEVSINSLMLHFEGKMIGSIHPFMVEQFKKARIEEGRAPATVNRDISTLRNMLNKAAEWGYIQLNPLTKKVKQMREDNEVMWVLTPDEEKKLLDACEKSPQRKKGKYLRDLVLFALHSAMRLSEILNLKKVDVDIKQRYVNVRDTKNKESRKVPINDTLKDIIERRFEYSCSEHLFSDKNGKKLTVLTNAFWNAVKKAGLIKKQEVRGKVKDVRFRFHDLRHSAGSRLGMKGIDLKTIMEIMGHKTHKMAMRYQHPTPIHKLNAMKILDEVPSILPTGQKVGEEKIRAIN